MVENNADPAAKPSRPSIRLKALVTATTHNTVSGNRGTRAASGSENHRQIENPHSAGEQHGSGDRLHGKFQIRAGAAEIVVDAETENQAGRNIDAEKHGGSESLDQPRKYEGEPQPHAQADRESQKYRDSPQTRKRGSDGHAVRPAARKPSLGGSPGLGLRA